MRVSRLKNHQEGGSKMNRRQLFLSMAKAALATAFSGLWFKKGAHAQAPTEVKFPNSTVLPTPTPPFAGVTEPNLVNSTPGWPPTIAPPAGAPNVLLILIDDAGYGANSVFGGIVPTPGLEKLAQRGLRYTQMHNTALCSPTRAALLTGRNHHGVGFGNIAEAATGYPGYDSIIPPETAHVAMTLKENGYSTAWFGKADVRRAGARGRFGRCRRTCIGVHRHHRIATDTALVCRRRATDRRAWRVLLG